MGGGNELSQGHKGTCLRPCQAGLTQPYKPGELCQGCTANPSPPSPTRAAISRDPFYEMLAARKKKVSSTKRH